jgi:hypothetical protein
MRIFVSIYLREVTYLICDNLVVGQRKNTGENNLEEMDVILE